MTRYVVSVAERRFIATDDQIQGLRERLSEAAQSGGSFVSFGVRGAMVEVLVTPGLPVFIEPISEPEPESELAAAGASTPESLAPAVDEFDDWGI